MRGVGGPPTEGSVQWLIVLGGMVHVHLCATDARSGVLGDGELLAWFVGGGVGDDPFEEAERLSPSFQRLPFFAGLSAASLSLLRRLNRLRRELIQLAKKKATTLSLCVSSQRSPPPLD